MLSHGTHTAFDFVSLPACRKCMHRPGSWWTILCQRLGLHGAMPHRRNKKKWWRCLGDVKWLYFEIWLVNQSCSVVFDYGEKPFIYNLFLQFLHVMESLRYWSVRDIEHEDDALDWWYACWFQRRASSKRPWRYHRALQPCLSRSLQQCENDVCCKRDYKAFAQCSEKHSGHDCSPKQGSWFENSKVSCRTDVKQCLCWSVLASFCFESSSDFFEKWLCGDQEVITLRTKVEKDEDDQMMADAKREEEQSGHTSWRVQN